MHPPYTHKHHINHPLSWTQTQYLSYIQNSIFWTSGHLTRNPMNPNIRQCDATVHMTSLSWPQVALKGFKLLWKAGLCRLGLGFETILVIRFDSYLNGFDSIKYRVFISISFKISVLQTCNQYLNIKAGNFNPLLSYINEVHIHVNSRITLITFTFE